VEREIDQFLRQSEVRPPKPFDIASVYIPSTSVAEKAVRYAHDKLDPAIFNHSNRVYYLGAVMVDDYLPQWKFDLDTYFLTSVLHDIGTAPSLQLTTALSFEYFGGIHAREKLLEFGAPNLQADEVAEGIIRHTDSHEGNIRQNGYIIQMTTTMDVRSTNPQWFHPHTVNRVIEKFPRLGFNNVFADRMQVEFDEKPGCYLSTRDVPTYLKCVRNNPFMELYDKQ
jgi:cyanamide hydratase